MTRQAGEYYLASDDLVFARSIRRIKAFNPNSGNVRLFSLTENQYEKMIILSGEKNNDEIQLNKCPIVIF